MKYAYILMLIFFAEHALAQRKTVDIYGTVKGEHKNNIFLFFDNDFAHRDSIQSHIDQTGNFHFRVQKDLPVLCRVYCGDKSNLLEFYIDSTTTTVTLISALTEKETPDSLGGARVHLSMESISGSHIQNAIDSFQQQTNRIIVSEQNTQLLHDKYLEALQQFVKDNAGNKAGLYVTAGRMYFLGQGFFFPNNLLLSAMDIETVLKGTDSSLKTTLEYQNLENVLERIRQSSHRTINDNFYHVILPDTSGKSVSTRSYTGKYVLVDFWASWCKPCRASIPELKQIYKTYNNKGFDIINISIDGNKDAWKKAVLDEQMKWTQLIDTAGVDGNLCKYYDIRVVPTQILLNREGKVIAFPNNADLEKILRKELVD